MSSWLSGCLLGFGLLAFGLPTAIAHTPDTSYAIVRMTANDLQVELRYDLESLSRLYPIDSDKDGVIQVQEWRGAESSLRKILRREVSFEFNEHPADFGEYLPARWPDGVVSVPRIHWDQTVIAFPFERKVREVPESVALSFHLFDLLGDRHKVLGVFEQPEKPPFEVVFDSLDRDYLYFTDFAPSLWSQLGSFIWLGVEHIFIGFDHILFLLGLMIVSKFWSLIKIVSSFTVAHTLTLVLAATGTVSLPSRWVEVCIAATIVYVASENLVRTAHVERWRLTFGFGLIHGFGFANVLQDLGLPREGLARCLLAFNLGVEIGQLAIVAAMWPLLKWLQSSKHSERLTKLFSALILILGAGWFVDRLLGLQWMPF